MNRPSMITIKQSESPKRVTHNYSQIHNIFNAESKGQHLLDDDSSSGCSPLYIQTESLNSPSLKRASPYLRQQLSPNPELNGPVSPGSHLQHPKNMFSRSSAFCTSLYLSSSISSETSRQLGNLPFLPHPPTCNQPIAAVHSSKSPLLLSGDFSNQGDEDSSEYLMKDFLNFPGESSDGGFHGENYANESLTFTEQLELQMLSEELDIAITGNVKNPRLDEIYEAPQVSSIPTTGMKCNQDLEPLIPDGQIHQSHPTPVAATAHKPRMRWTPELHERFIEAVNKLDGAEKATPKGILKIMKVEGLTIYHVKSHLQKYRLAKYMPETKEGKKASSSEEKKTTSTECDARVKRSLQVTEALRMQMEVQKQLHEQLEVQRTLQLRIEEHARYLQKILEEQKKAGGTLIAACELPSLPSLTSPQSESEPKPKSSSTCASPQPESKIDSTLTAKHKATDCTQSEQPTCQKRVHCEAKMEIASGETLVENPGQ
ncbi:myb family transcription factor PHL6 [Telopea speciosissima]|uniref:myb family transcription factor PHL6 n=1 Tax=Telopea speciosissima TaxID=54955 RepID=UPI001CC54E63|nr:myb family transcription factor PHL6 [Telopea speciosissima]XP_043713582.1 myb family transcription factor PHL6 [Telopea speciosissima]XP_043713583.1 myb family transcription factor PHL6 [Telopea speciosissima]